MTLHSEIAQFLGSRVKTPYCDDCISLELGGNNVADVGKQTESMRSDEPEFPDGGWVCARCGKRKITTMAVVASGQ